MHIPEEFAPESPGNAPAVAEHPIGVEFSIVALTPPLTIGTDVELPAPPTIHMNPAEQFDLLCAADNTMRCARTSGFFALLMVEY